MIDLEEIKRLVLEGEELEHILERVDWKEFENTVAEIFKANGFSVRQNFRFGEKRRNEIDILARRGEVVFAVDCKHWKGGRYKKSQLKVACEKQKKRCRFLELMHRKVRPLIVTLLDEDLMEENGVYIVPVWKLNSFLLSFEKLP